MVYKFFDVCSDDEDIKKMRGLVPEKLFKIIFDERHLGKVCNIGYGVSVLIDGKKVKYIAENPYQNIDDSDINRQTVDAGFWDGIVGEFVEIKLKPESFQTKDINYLRLLSSELDKENISHTIFLVALENKELINQKLKRLGLIGDGICGSSEFELIGKEELFSFKVA